MILRSVWSETELHVHSYSYPFQIQHESSLHHYSYAVSSLFYVEYCIEQYLIEGKIKNKPSEYTSLVARISENERPMTAISERNMAQIQDWIQNLIFWPM